MTDQPDTLWEREVDRTTLECVAASEAVEAQGGPVQSWPISSQGTTKVTTWNPPGWPLFPGKHGTRRRKGRLY